MQPVSRAGTGFLPRVAPVSPGHRQKGVVGEQLGGGDNPPVHHDVSELRGVCVDRPTWGSAAVDLSTPYLEIELVSVPEGVGRSGEPTSFATRLRPGSKHGRDRRVIGSRNDKGVM